MVAKRNDNKFNLTKSVIEKFPIPEKREDGKIKNLMFFDIKQTGLCVICSYGGSKTFYLYVNIKGRPEKIKLGKFPDISVEQARKLAVEKRGIINQGKNPNEEKKKINNEITFKELFSQYIQRHCSMHNKPNTIKAYYGIYKNYFHELEKKKISQITKSDIERFHTKIGNEKGKYMANKILNLIKSMYNRASQWGFEGKNPALFIKKFKEVSRDRYLKPEEMAKFFESLSQEANFLLKNYFLIALLTGARKDNILSMKWQDLDFILEEWRIPETKSGEVVKIPLMKNAIEILKEIKNYHSTASITSDYVFFSKTSASGHIEEPKKAWRRILTNANINDLRIHDLRRTLGSYQAMSGSSLHIIGKSLGHKSLQSTEVYARMNLDPVRESVKKATDRIFEFRKKK